MGSILDAINAAYVAVNDGFSGLVQSATDPKVQAVALRVLATVCIVSAVALASASLSGRVSVPEGLIISAALLVIAYGLILGAQHLEETGEIDLEWDSFSVDDAPPIVISDSSVEEEGVEEINQEEEEEFFDARPLEFDSSIIFGTENFISAMNKLDNPVIPYCFFNDSINSRVICLLYRKRDETFGRDYNVAKRALEGVDSDTLLGEASLQSFKDKLHQMALDAIKAHNAED